MNMRYTELLSGLPGDVLHIAGSFANDYGSPEIQPAHLFRALLHKSAGLVEYIEVTLDSDYFYLVDWCEIRMSQCERSPYRMKAAVLSVEAEAVVREAVEISERCGLPSLTAQCLLVALLTPGLGFSFEQLKTMPLQSGKVLKSITSDNGMVITKGTVNVSVQTSDAEVSEYVVPMLSVESADEIVGMESEIRSMIDVLARKDRANVMIVGDAGVGKTSLIEGLVNKLRAGIVPSSLSSLHPFELDTISLCQGVSYKGEIEDRFKKLTNSLSCEAQPVLVVENFHRIEDRQSVLNGILPNLKKLLSKNQIQVICTATTDGYTKDIEKDKELMNFFEKIIVEEPNEMMAVAILSEKKDAYETFHHLPIEENVLSETVRLAKRYMPDKRLPSSALDLLDRAMASVKIENEISGMDGETSEHVVNKILDKEIVRGVVSGMTGIPMGNIQSEEREKLTNGEQILHRRVIGQNHAVKSILDAIFESRSGLNKKGQPIGSFFFLGPTGTGKTELAKALAEFLFNDESSILRFDMSEYKEEHSVALLYGAPPGYVGYEEGGAVGESDQTASLFGGSLR